MNIFVTEKKRLWRSSWVLAAVLLPPSAVVAETPDLFADTRLRLSAELRATAVFETSPYADDDLTSFFDQYRYVATENDLIPWHVDLRTFSVALEREDGTSPISADRESLGWLNERGEVRMVTEPVRGRVYYDRYRSGDLRVFPEGTDGFAPTLGSVYQTELPASSPRGEDHRLYTRRNLVGGEVVLRPDQGKSAWLAPTEGRFFGEYQRVAGKRQDRFLVEDLGLAAQNERFRGRIRDLDQDWLTLGFQTTLVSRERMTTTAEFRYEGQRERAPTITYGVLSEEIAGFAPSGDPLIDARAYRFVPDSDHFSASLRTTGQIGSAKVKVAAQYAHLTQAGQRAPLQDALNLDDNEIDSGFLRAALEIPLARALDLSGYVRGHWRENQVDRSAIRSSALSGEQTNAFIKRRLEGVAGVELVGKPRAGTRVSLGSEFVEVDRKLEFGSGALSIPDSINLIDSTTRELSVFLKGRQRVGRSSRVAAEVGYTWAPEVAFVRDVEDEVYVKARTTISRPLRIPATLGLHGEYRWGESDELHFASAVAGGGRSKGFDRESWSYGSTLTAWLPKDIYLVGSFVHSRDEEAIEHIRSNLPRNSGDPSLQFFVDSRPDYSADFKNLAVTTTIPFLESLESRWTAGVAWVDVGFSGGRRTPRILDRTNPIQQRILSLESAFVWRRGQWKAEIGYRYDDFDDQEDLEILDLDVSAHTGWIGIGFEYD